MNTLEFIDFLVFYSVIEIQNSVIEIQSVFPLTIKQLVKPLLSLV